MSRVTLEKARKLAEKLMEEFTIGTGSTFCDTSEFDSASVEEIVEVIMKEFEND